MTTRSRPPLRCQLISATCPHHQHHLLALALTTVTDVRRNALSVKELTGLRGTTSINHSVTIFSVVVVPLVLAVASSALITATSATNVPTACVMITVLIAAGPKIVTTKTNMNRSAVVVEVEVQGASEDATVTVDVEADADGSVGVAAVAAIAIEGKIQIPSCPLPVDSVLPSPKR